MEIAQLTPQVYIPQLQIGITVFSLTTLGI